MVGRRRGDYRAGNRPVQRGLYRVEAFRGMAYRYAGAAAQETVVLTDRTQPFVITISDEYGSGDHRIGELLAQRLGVKFYDRELISLTAHIVMDESGRYGKDEKHAEAKIKSGWHCPFHLGDGVDALALSRLRPDCGFRFVCRLIVRAAVLLGSQPHHPFEEFAEEAGRGEVELVGYLRHIPTAVAKHHLGLCN